MRLAMMCVVCYVVRGWQQYYLRKCAEPVSRNVTHDAHHSQAHSQQRTLTQHDMLPQHPVNIKELFCECFKSDFSKEQRSSLRMIIGSKHVGAILSVLM